MYVSPNFCPSGLRVVLSQGVPKFCPPPLQFPSDAKLFPIVLLCGQNLCKVNAFDLAAVARKRLIHALYIMFLMRTNMVCKSG